MKRVDKGKVSGKDSFSLNKEKFKFEYETMKLMKKIIKMFLAACIAVNLVRAMMTPLPPEPDYVAFVKQLRTYLQTRQLESDDLSRAIDGFERGNLEERRRYIKAISKCLFYLQVEDPSIQNRLTQISMYLNTALPHKVLQSAAENYFKQSLDVTTADIKFFSKLNGRQLGDIVHIKKGGKFLRFYCKTHSFGSTSTSSSLSTYPVDVDELIVYKFLEHLGVGPKTHFFFNDEKNFYIATKDIGQYDDDRPDDDVLTYEQVRNDAQLIGCSWETFSKEQEQLVSPIIIQALVVIDVVSRILGLSDAITNPGNFCFTKNKASQTLTGFKLIDFRNAGGIPRKEEIFEGFKKGNGAYNYPTSKDPLIKHFLADKDMQERRTLVLQYLNPGQMLSILDIVKTEIEPIVSLQNSKESYLGNLEKHIRYIRENIEAFFADLGKAGE